MTQAIVEMLAGAAMLALALCSSVAVSGRRNR